MIERRFNFNLLRDDIVLRATVPQTIQEISQWNFVESIKKVRDILDNWIGLTEELLHELWIARLNFRSQGQKPKNGKPVFGWGEYCKAIGIKKATANRWLRRYDPKTRKILPKPKKKPKKKEGDKAQVRCPKCEYVFSDRLIDLMVIEAIEKMK